MTESFRTADGRALSYRRLGSGPILIAHPGGPGFSSRYLADLAGLGEARTLVLLNPRGSEGSDPAPGPTAYAIPDYAADVEELRLHLGLETIDLLGHSHGGVVAMAYAALQPTRVRRLVLASTLARFATEQEAAMRAGMEARADEPWYEDACAALEAEQAGAFSTAEELGELAVREFPFYFARYGDAEREYLDGLRGEPLCVDALKTFNEGEFTTFDLRPQLAAVSTPTLVIAGAEDFITGPVCAAEIAAAVPHAETVILPDTGHFIFVEARDRFRDEVLSFLA